MGPDGWVWQSACLIISIILELAWVACLINDVMDEYKARLRDILHLVAMALMAEKSYSVTVDKDRSKESKKKCMTPLEAFDSVTPNLKLQLELVIDGVSGKLMSEGVIPEKIHDQVFDKSYKGSNWRSQYFVRQLRWKIKEAEKESPQNNQKAKEIIQILADALREDSECIERCSG